jgi:hypothetical protein
VDEEVEPAPALGQAGEQPVEAGGVGHVGGQDVVGAQLLGERPDPLEQRVALVGDGELAPCAWTALAIPQASERSFAMPRIRPSCRP